MQRIAAKFVPRLLSNDQTNTALLSSTSWRNRPKRPQLYLHHHYWWPAWVFGQDPKTKQQSSQGKTPTSPWPKKAWQVRNTVKSMSIYFYDIEDIRNLFHQDTWWMEISIEMFWGAWGKTSGANILRENFWCKHTDKWHNNSCTLHHDKAVVHSLLIVLQFLASTKITVVPHLPYSLDRAPCDFFLFLKMKLKLKGWCFDSIEEIQTELQDVMKMLTWNDFQQCFPSWKSCWDRCNNAEVDYLPGMEARKGFC